MLAQSAEVTHESGVLDDAAVVEALGQTEGECRHCHDVRAAGRGAGAV